MNYKFKTAESKNSFDLFQNGHFCSLGSTVLTAEGPDQQGTTDDPTSGDPDVVIPPKK